jgi:hypothetical protein
VDSLGKETRRDVHRIAVRGRNLSARAVENSDVCRILHTGKSCDVRPSLGMLSLFPAASWGSSKRCAALLMATSSLLGDERVLSVA